MIDTLRDRLGALVRERLVDVLARHQVEHAPFNITRKARRWSCRCGKWGEKDDIIACLNAAREHVADEFEAALAAQPAPAVMGEGENWWTEAAIDVIRHARTNEPHDDWNDWQNAITNGILRAYNRGRTAAAESREESQ